MVQMQGLRICIVPRRRLLTRCAWSCGPWCSTCDVWSGLQGACPWPFYGEGAGIASLQRPDDHRGSRRCDRRILVGGRMFKRNAASADGLGLADAIGLLRDELLTARAAGADSDIQLPVESMTVDLTVTATRSLDGKAGFTVPVVGLQLGGGGARERGSEQKVTVVFGEPVDREGRPVKVAQASSERKG
jgi:Trypsin-co-occurring domain 2